MREPCGWHDLKLSFGDAESFDPLALVPGHQGGEVEELILMLAIHPCFPAHGNHSHAILPGPALRLPAWQHSCHCSLTIPAVSTGSCNANGHGLMARELDGI